MIQILFPLLRKAATMENEPEHVEAVVASASCGSAPLESLVVVSRGKVGSANGLMAMDLAEPTRVKKGLLVSSKFGLVLQIIGSQVAVYRWRSAEGDGVEDCSDEMEAVLIDKANVDKERDCVKMPKLLGRLVCCESGEGQPLQGFAICEHDETLVCAWSATTLFMFDLSALGGVREPLWNWNMDTGKIEDACFVDGKNEVIVISPNSVCLIDAETSKEKRHVILKHDSEALVVASCPGTGSSHVAIGETNGYVRIVNMYSSEVIWSFHLADLPEDPVQAHAMLWLSESLLVVGYRADSNGDELGAFPRIGLFHVDFESQKILGAVHIEDPLEFDSKDRPWMHRFYFEKIPHINGLLAVSTWSQNCAIFTYSSDPALELQRREVIHGNESTSTPEVCPMSMWSLVERPWCFADLGENEDDKNVVIQDKTYVMGMALSRCTQSPVIPFRIFGDQGELDNRPDFSPPPTLVLLTSDGVLEIFALADTNYTVSPSGSGIPGMVKTIQDLPSTCRERSQGQQDGRKETILSHPGEAVKSKNSTFDGPQPGFVFTTRNGVTNYYPDNPPEISYISPAKMKISKQQARAAVADFYHRVNPMKLNSVDTTVDKYEGNYAVLFDRLQTKYPGQLVNWNLAETNTGDAVSAHFVSQSEANPDHFDSKSQGKTGLLFPNEEPRSALFEKKDEPKARLSGVGQQLDLNISRSSTERKSGPFGSRDEAKSNAFEVKKERCEVHEHMPVFVTKEDFLEEKGEEMTTQKRSVKEESKEAAEYRKRLEDEIAKLKSTNASLVSELQLRKEKSVLKEPPHVELLALTLEDKKAGPKKKVRSSALVGVPQSDEPEQETERLLHGILLVMNEKSIEMKDEFGDAQILAWKEKDRELFKHSAQLQATCENLMTFSRDGVHEKMRTSADKLSAFRRNFFRMETEFKNLVSRLEAIRSGQDKKSWDAADRDPEIQELRNCLRILTEQLEEAELFESFMKEEAAARIHRLKLERKEIERRRNNAKQDFKGVKTEAQNRFAPVEIMRRSLKNFEDSQRILRRLQELNANLHGVESLIRDSVDLNYSTEEGAIPKQASSSSFMQSRFKGFASEEVSKPIPTIIEERASIAALDKALRDKFEGKRVVFRDSNGAEAKKAQFQTRPRETVATARKNIRWQRNIVAQGALALDSNQRDQELDQSAIEFIESFSRPRPKLDASAEEALSRFADPPKFKPALSGDAAEVSWNDSPSKIPETGRTLLRRSTAAASVEDTSETKPSSQLKSISEGETCNTEKDTEQKSESSKSLFGGLSGFGSQTATNQAAPTPKGGTLAPSDMTRDLSNVDMKRTLVEFYNTHKPELILKVDNALSKYAGDYNRMLDLLEKKYQAKVQLIPKQEGFSQQEQQQPNSQTSSFSGFGSASNSTSLFGSPQQKQQTPQPPQNPFGGFGTPNPQQSSFQQQQHTPQQQQQSSFGGFGGGGGAQISGDLAGLKQKLIEFYQRVNPSKVHSIEDAMQKYRGQEMKLMDNLERKYNAQGFFNNIRASFQQGTSGSATGGSGFGMSSGVGSFGSISTPQSSGGGFGTTSGFGSTSSFGGGTTTSPFGTQQQSSFGGFGTPSQTSNTFSSLGGNIGGGSFSQQQQGFGGSSFSSFGNQNSSSFGSPLQQTSGNYTGASFTQMRK